MSDALIPIGQEWQDIRAMSHALYKSGFLPNHVNTPEKACAIILMSRELGIGPMEGFSQINVIQGKPSQSPQLMKARVHGKLPKAIFRLVESSDKIATFEAARPGDPIQKYSFTIEEAEKLGLTGKDNYKKQPATMLVWRCIAKVARQVFPDCLSGVCYTPEELGAAVNEEGEVIQIQVSGEIDGNKSEENKQTGAAVSDSGGSALGVVCGIPSTENNSNDSSLSQSKSQKKSAAIEKKESTDETYEGTKTQKNEFIKIANELGIEDVPTLRELSEYLVGIDMKFLREKIKDFVSLKREINAESNRYKTRRAVSRD